MSPRQSLAQTPLEESTARQQALPDFEYIKARIPVMTIASDLGLKVTSPYKARCWRTEHHRNGDADPSIRFKKSKNRWRCFVCDQRSLSNLDLVMMVKGMTVVEAAQWINSRHYVPPVFALLIPLIVFRLLNEEKVLRQELPGYSEYCLRTRFRLVPYLW